MPSSLAGSANSEFPKFNQGTMTNSSTRRWKKSWPNSWSINRQLQDSLRVKHAGREVCQHLMTPGCDADEMGGLHSSSAVQLQNFVQIKAALPPVSKTFWPSNPANSNKGEKIPGWWLYTLEAFHQPGDQKNWFKKKSNKKKTTFLTMLTSRLAKKFIFGKNCFDPHLGQAWSTSCRSNPTKAKSYFKAKNPAGYTTIG